MPNQQLQLSDFLAQAQLILDESYKKRGDNLYMLKVEDDDEDDDPVDDEDLEGSDEGDEDNDEDEADEEGAQAFVKEDGKPFTKSDYDALQAALKKERREKRALQRAARGKGSDDGAAAAKAAEEKYKPVIVKQAAKAAFASAGLVLPEGKEASALTKAMKLLDMGDLELSEDGDVEGLEDQIDEIKEEFPELFVKKNSSTGRRRLDGADRGDSVGGRKKDSADVLAGQLSR